MMDARMSGTAFNLWMNAGGDKVLSSFGLPLTYTPDWHKSVESKYWQFLEQTQPFMQIDKWIFVHSGLQTGVSLNNQSEEWLYWKKQEIPQMYSNKNIVICGHTSRKNGQISDFNHTICIDTFAYGGQSLTALEIESGKFYQCNEEGEFQSGEL
jgi:serine/threonine protein phosphatase 1